MTAWFFLLGAIVTEVGGTLSLRRAVDDRRWYAAVAAGYLAAFPLLALTLAQGMPLGMAYGIWVAAGVALTAVLSRVIFKEALTRLMILGLALIAAGVLLIELGSAP